jgi:hypothetical protein
MRFSWKAAAPTQTANQNPFWAFDPPGSYPVSFDRGAKINRRATELQIMAGGKGLGASDAVIAIATALGNEVAAMVIRHPSLTIEEMLELVCQSVREVAHIAAGSSPEALKGTESAQLVGGSKGEFGRDAIKGAQQFDGWRRT